ncbi:MAG: NAD(P)-dependent dehydrogenase, short-chain alcohol dehydrogenase family [Chloroflexi bacterium]|jgi:NAD(P)-dependent dehydrogenase (short-subunit alcohol dehydrogenase family)|nr:MAG: NAD(P)-dependent dehydrogenase, short-chain alcohol dehydrogenase family [Chloroflexota bacterium]
MGRAAAELFASEGCIVVIAGRRENLGIQVASEIKHDQGECMFVNTDVSVSSDVQKLVNITMDNFGKLDILFNNARINNPSQQDPHQKGAIIFESVLDVNLKGAFLCTKYTVGHMITTRFGSIINNSSVLDTRATDSSSTSYHVSKGGMAMLTKKSSLSYAKYNIRVNSIQPGAIATEMSGVDWNDLNNEDVNVRRSKMQPISRMGLPVDIAYAALFFASEESSFVTGASLLVDGATSAAYNWTPWTYNLVYNGSS